MEVSRQALGYGRATVQPGYQVEFMAEWSQSHLVGLVIVPNNTLDIIQADRDRREEVTNQIENFVRNLYEGIRNAIGV